MADYTANVIPLNESQTKLYVIGVGVPNLQNVTSITYDSQSYNVVRVGGRNTDWMYVDTPPTTFTETRVTISF